jgi:hypothetical protein
VRDAVIGGRIRARVVYENGETGILSIAVTNRLIPPLTTMTTDVDGSGGRQRTAKGIGVRSDY